MRATSSFRALLGAGLLLCPWALGTASAVEPVETAIREWVTAIDVSPDWAASYRSLVYDPATRTATISNLNVRSERGGFTMDVESISVADYAATVDGGFTASSITADGGAIDAGIIKFAISDVALDDLAVPGLRGFVYDQTRPFTSMMRAYAEIAKTRLAQGRIGEMAMVEQIEGVTHRMSYGRMTFDGLADGKLRSMRAGPLKLESPSPEGLVTMTFESAESRDFDLAAFVHVYSPDEYVGGVGDEVWRQALGLVAYHNIKIEAPGAKITLREIAMEDWKVRQPKKSFAELFDQLMVNPDMPEEQGNKLALHYVPDMFSAFGIGRFSLEELDVQAEGVNRMHLGGIRLVDFSSDGLGEFSIDGLDGSVEGQGDFKMGRFAFGGMTFPSRDAVVAAIEASEAGGQVNPMTLIPTLGFFELAGIDIATPDIERMRLGKLRVDLGNYIGPVPTSVETRLTGLEAPVSAIEDRESRRMFERLGYDRIDVSYGLRLNYDTATEKLTMDELSFGIENVGSFNSSAVFSGLPRQAIEDPKLLEMVLPGMSLVKASATFKDESIVGKGLDILAEQMKAPPEKFRQQFADAMPFLLSMTVLTDPGMMAILNKSGLFKKLTPAVKTFVAEPGASITVTLDPASPVLLTAIEEASKKAPDTLVNLLGMDISGAPGTLTPPSPEPTSPSPSQDSPAQQQPQQGGMRPSVPAE